MTDAEFTYHSTNKERAVLSRMARSKQNGAKSKKCSLPSDGMTRKEWKEKNGEVITYNLSKPMSWAEYKKLPDDVKKEYIEKLVVKYNATGAMLARMLCVSDNYLTAHLRELFGGETPLRRGGHSKPSAEWFEFLAPYEASEEAPTEDAKELIKVKETQQTQPQRVKLEDKAMFSVEHGEVTIKGQPNAALAKFLMLLELEAEYTFMISFRKELTFEESEANT